MADVDFATPESAQPTGGAERRQLSILFCDLVGSTELAVRLDAEELRDVIAAFQDACAAQVARTGGYIARYMGDGMLVYFGYPRAHEDDAARAVRAGLAIVEAAQALDGLSVQPRVRVGIATGAVVVGDLIGEGGSAERAVIGETPNLAARLQALAEPDTVVVSETTAHLVRARFELADLGRHPLKGFAEPVPASRVVGPARRSYAAATEPLIGRGAELAALDVRLAAAARGEGSVVAIVGESGTGKSRLLQAFLEEAESSARPARLLRCACERHHENAALHPLTDALGRAAGFELRDAVDTRRRKLRAWLAGRSVTEVGDRAALETLLALDDDEGAADEPGADRRRRILEALFRLCVARGAQEPTLLVIEDVQWADPTTLELLSGIAERCAEVSTLLAATHRPDFEAPWREAGCARELRVGALADGEARELIVAVAGDRELSEDTVRAIVERAEGVPAFLVELTRAVAGEDAVSASVPASLRDSLAAQLDGLGWAREVAQLASCVGREFSADLLTLLYPGGVARLFAGLDALVAAGVVTAPARPGERYAFRQALMHDVAYDSLLKSARVAQHARIAEVLTSSLPSVAAATPDLVAFHLDAAGRGRAASEWWQKAAAQATANAAWQESAAHARAAAASLSSVVDEAEPKDVEQLAERLVDLSRALRLVDGHEEAVAALDRAEDLAGRHDRFATLSDVWFARGNVYFNLDPSRTPAAHERALDYAKRAGDALRETRALGGLADAAVLEGNVERAAELGVRCVDVAEANRFDQVTATNAAVAAWALYWALRPEEALRYARLGERRATEQKSPRAMLNAHYAPLLIALAAGDVGEAGRRLQAMTASGAAGLPTIRMLIGVARCQLRQLQGRPAEGLAELDELLDRVPRSDLAWATGAAARLLAVDDTELPVALHEVLVQGAASGRLMIPQFAEEVIVALTTRAAWEPLDGALRALAEVFVGARIPLLDLWQRAARAALVVVTAPDNDDARSAAEQLRDEARSRRLGRVDDMLTSVLDAHRPDAPAS